MVDAQSLTKDLGGTWYRRYGAAPCPVCQAARTKRQNALTIADGRNGRLMLNCKKSSCAFTDILAAAGLHLGAYSPPDPAKMARRDAEHLRDAEKRARQAHSLWDEARPITESLADTYLRGRGITCDLPATLRLHPACWHSPTAKRYPAMIALVQGGANFSVHRTYLRADGAGKADNHPSKMMLGTTAGGAVRLTSCAGPLLVAEGIETALSLACGLLRGPATIWAALSTSGLRSLNLPPTPERLILAADGEAAGRDAANALASKASALGWRVSMLPAPEGRDWNDILNLKGDAA
ncbi:MAG: toprim domain-containing protein [Paracoccaceae bacterium]